MVKEFHAHRLDVRAFAEAGGQLSGAGTVGRHERLSAETRGMGLDQPLTWQVRGELRHQRHSHPQIWLHLSVDTVLALACQRCLEPVDTPVSVDRWFRFVADEATAEAEDEQSEEDLLVLSRQFNLLALVEDEVLMALPLVPRHAQCPVAVAMTLADPQAEQQSSQPHPFAVLQRLKNPGPEE